MTNVNVTVSIIAKTITGFKKIVIKTMKNNCVNDLIKHQHIWKSIVKPIKIVENETWHKILAHGINTKFAKNMHELKSDIEHFNSDIKLANDSKWMSAFHLEKSYSSMILNITDEKDLQIALKEINVNKGRVNTAKFQIKTTMQCTICHQFGHGSWTCKNAPKCRICAKNNQTIMHKCNVCNANKTCTHTPAKCSNCHGNHETNSQNCEINRTLKRKLQNTFYEHRTIKFSKH